MDRHSGAKDTVSLLTERGERTAELGSRDRAAVTRKRDLDDRDTRFAVKGDEEWNYESADVTEERVACWPRPLSRCIVH